MPKIRRTAKGTNDAERKAASDAIAVQAGVNTIADCRPNHVADEVAQFCERQSYDGSMSAGVPTDPR
jgi:hypothetical protein